MGEGDLHRNISTGEMGVDTSANAHDLLAPQKHQDKLGALFGDFF